MENDSFYFRRFAKIPKKKNSNLSLPLKNHSLKKKKDQVLKIKGPHDLERSL